MLEFIRYPYHRDTIDGSHSFSPIRGVSNTANREIAANDYCFTLTPVKSGGPNGLILKSTTDLLIG
jgi:hypothetical protein